MAKKKVAPRTKKKASAPDVLQYDDYVEYLKDYFDYRKEQGKEFSYRAIANRIGVTYSHIHKLFTGKRKFSEESLEKLVQLMGLEGFERVYFLLLVESGPSVRVKVEKADDHTDILPVLIVYEMVNLRDFRPDSHWISERVGQCISPEQARDALKKLMKEGLILHNGKVWKHDKKREVLNLQSSSRDFPKQALQLTSHSLQQKGLSLLYFSLIGIDVKRARKLYDDIVKLVIEAEKESDGSGKSKDLISFTVAASKITGKVKHDTFL